MLAITIIAVICLGILLLILLGVQGLTKYDNDRSKRIVNRFYLFLYALVIFPIVAIVLLYIK